MNARWRGPTLALSLALLPLILATPAAAAVAAAPGIPAFTVHNGGAGQSYTLTIQLLVLMTAITLLPAALLMMTAFTRIIIVLSILRQAIGAGQSPPNQRVFEQLEMLRAESRKMLEAQAQAAAVVLPAVGPSARTVAGERQVVERPLTAPAPIERPVIEPTALDFLVAPAINSNAYLSASALAAHGLAPAEIAARCGLPAGEARLLASLASARVRRDQAGEAAPGQAAADATVPASAARSSAG
jgi:hypothetical protein